MPDGNGHDPAPRSVCAQHDADIDQLTSDLRLLNAAHRDLESRQATTDGSLGQIAAELATCRRASERAADSAFATLEAVRSIASDNLAAHERICGRLADLEARTVPAPAPESTPLDYEVGEDTAIQDRETLIARAYAAEAALRERHRTSDRAMVRDTLAVKRWQIVAGAVVALGTGGGLALLARLFGG